MVVAAAITDGGGLWLMHRRPIEKAHGGLWEYPGGKVEAGESLGAALVRELKEELGIAVSPSDLSPVTFADSSANSSESPIVIFLYTLRKWAREPQALEGGAIRWFTPDAITKLDKPPLDVELTKRLFSELADKP